MCYSFMKFLLIFCTGLIFAKLVNLCEFTAWCLDVLADKLHPRFDQKFLSKKVWLIRGVYVHLIEYNDKSLVKQNVYDFFLLPAEQFQAILGSNKSC